MANYWAIIPLSGGLDSCAAAYYMLRQHPDKHFLLLHIELLNEESQHRCTIESQACEKIVAYFKAQQLNNFDYVVSRFDYLSAGYPPIWDIEGINFIAGAYVRAHPSIQCFVKGAIWEDFQQSDYPDRLRNSEQIFYQISERKPEEFEFLFPMKTWNKDKVYHSVPPELAALTWSCRTPADGQACGTCHTCKELKNINR